MHTLINQRLNFTAGDTFQQNAAVEVYMRDKSLALENVDDALTATTDILNDSKD